MSVGSAKIVVVPTFAFTTQFQSDFKHLSERDQQRFRRVIREQFVPDVRAGIFRPALRVRGVEGAPGVYEMTWERGDGRATWQYGSEQRQGEPHVIWRRIGKHTVFKDP